ncbi:DUF4123 domain-containing protein [Grimontia sp. SpTr1]|uniref:DUF4123 domain-containing protein n=1 Tax=Grimontia sp. SpTr1 TaxID=2995319 RepID=UPI00248B917C|nr:DUF4123 domain-containing protein [Grimontia sp. SpTr1]
MPDFIPQYVLIVDTLRVTDAIAIATSHEKKWFYLYENTPWQSQLKNSPVCISITQDDAIWALWQNNSLWASSAVVFEFGNTMSPQSITQTLQKHITVNSQDGRLFLLRFYSPNALSVLMARMGNDEKQIFFGAADAVLTSFNVAESQPFTRYEPPSIKTVLEDKDLVLDNSLVEAMFQ